MILTDEDIEHRLAHEDNLINVIGREERAPVVSVVHIPTHGKIEGTKNIPDKMRELLGSLSNVDGPSIVADIFDVDNSVTSRASRGLVKDRFDPSLKAAANKLEDKSTTAHDKALDLLMLSLDALKPKLPEVLKAKDISKIATDMSRIAANLAPKESSGNVNNTQVILFAPPQRKEAMYETAEV